jgi:hypothetical protein
MQYLSVFYQINVARVSCCEAVKLCCIGLENVDEKGSALKWRWR